MSHKLIEYSRNALPTELAARVSDELNQALTRNGRATLVVPGGSTPGPFMTALSNQDVDWMQVTVLASDERWVPVASERSNASLITKYLLRNKATNARFVPYYVGTSKPEQAIGSLSNAIAPYLPIDICVLGMGADGHIASLFPGGSHLEQAMDLTRDDTLSAMYAPGAPEARVSLTLKRLLEAEALHLLISGQEKRAVLEAALHGNSDTNPPVSALGAHSTLTVHYCI